MRGYLYNHSWRSISHSLDLIIGEFISRVNSRTIAKYLYGLLMIVVFFALIVLPIWLSGLFILHRLRLKLTTPEPFVLPTVTGLLAFFLVTYALSWIHLLVLIIPLAAASGILAIRQRLWKYTIAPPHRIPLVFTFICSIAFSLPMLVTGISETRAVYRTDDIIHLAYINELVHHFPPDNPGVAGVPLKGYHFFSDFLIASAHVLTGLTPAFLYFQGIPALTALLWGTGTYSLLFLWRKRVDTALWGVFLVLFGGSFAWWLRVTGHPEASLRSTYGIDQPASALLNPPYALSVALVLGGMLFAHEYLKTRKIGWLMLLGATAGILPMIKVYAGILLIAGFVIIIMSDIFRKRFTSLAVAAGSAVIFLATYGVFAGTGGYLLWAPLWAPRKVLIDSMPWYGYAEKLYTFGSFGMWWRILGVELYGIYLFVVGNLGTRALGLACFLLPRLTKPRKPSVFAVVLFALMGVSLLIPLFFLQSIKVFEIIQMGWYYPLFAALIGAVGISFLIRHTPTAVGKILVSAIVIAVTLPSTYENFISTVYPAKHLIRTNPTQDPYWKIMTKLGENAPYDATVIELPVKETPSTHLDVLSWYRVTLPYPSALGNKRSFFHSQNIDFPNVPLDERTKTIGSVLTLERLSGKEATFAAALEEVRSTLADYSVEYIITQFPLTRLSPAGLALTSLPYYLYRLKN